MATMFDILAAAGRAGLGSEGAAAASTSASGMAQRVREWAQAIAAQVEAECQELVEIAGASVRCTEMTWESVSGDAFREKVHDDVVENVAVREYLGDSAVQVRASGEAVAGALDALAVLIGGAGAALDTALMSLGSIEDVLDDVVVHAERVGAFALKSALTAHMSDPLLAQAGGALASFGR